MITQTLIQDNVIADNGYYPGFPPTAPNGPGISQGTTGIALIAEIGGTDTPSPMLSHTNVGANTILKVTIDDLSIAASENRDLKAELADAGAHAVHGGVVLTRIAGVEDETVDGPDLDCQRLRCCEHLAPE